MNENAGNADDALINAASRGDAAGVEDALKRGADPEAVDDLGETALQVAACNGSESARCVELLLKAGADVNRRNIYGETALIAAARSGDAASLKKLIAAGAELDVRSRSTNSDGGTALGAAVYHDHARCVEILLDAGADPNVADKSGAYPIEYALRSARSVKALVKAGGTQALKDELNTPVLVQAAQWADADVVNALIDGGADVGCREAYIGNTPLHAAAERGNIAAVRVLIAAGADRHARNDAGRTPYELVDRAPVSKGQVEEIKRLLKGGAALNERRMRRRALRESFTKERLGIREFRRMFRGRTAVVPGNYASIVTWDTPTYYVAGVYGHNFDVYVVDGKALITGDRARGEGVIPPPSMLTRYRDEIHDARDNGRRAELLSHFAMEALGAQEDEEDGIWTVRLYGWNPDEELYCDPMGTPMRFSSRAEAEAVAANNGFEHPCEVVAPDGRVVSAFNGAGRPAEVDAVLRSERDMRLDSMEEDAEDAFPWTVRFFEWNPDEELYCDPGLITNFKTREDAEKAARDAVGEAETEVVDPQGKVVAAFDVKGRETKVGAALRSERDMRLEPLEEDAEDWMPEF